MKGKSVGLIGEETLAVTPAGDANYTNLHGAGRAKNDRALRSNLSSCSIKRGGQSDGGIVFLSELASERLLL